MTDDRTRELTADVRMPYLGFGTYLIEDDAAPDVVGQALSAGYRHIDTAEGYHNERGVGEAIRRAIDAGTLTRDELFVTTKVFPGNPEWGMEVKDAEATIAALDASLERLGLDHVDLYLIHAPFAGDQRLEEWRALLELKKQGKTRAVGVSNYGQAHIDEIAEAGLELPAANQLELHPWSQKPALVGYLEEKGITPIAYSSLLPLSTWRAKEGEASAKTDEMREAGQDSPFAEMAKKYGVTEAQVLLRWGIQKGYPVLPKSTNPDRIRQNADLFSFAIDADDMGRIDGMDRGEGVAWSMGDPTKAP